MAEMHQGESSSSCSSNADLTYTQSEHKVLGAEGTTPLEETVDKLLQKQRNELMFELRKLQHGDRPVTGQGNKEAVENFFQRAVSGETDQAAIEQNRPEHVTVEVNALVQRRPVSSVLRSAGFRRSLEAVLRSSLGSGSRPSLNISQRPPFVAPTPSNQQQRNNTPQSSRLANNVRTEATVESERNSRHDSEPEVVPSTENRIRNAESWLQEHPAPANQRDGIDLNIWDTIEEAQRQIVLEDISELVHRQLVTTSLQGNFRNTLERNLQAHILHTGTDGERVEQYIRSLPPSRTHRRNDFADIGLPPPPVDQVLVDQLSDEVSVISATAAVSVPYAQSGAAMSREMQSLKAQMREMLIMMKCNFDLTMDIQRSIRQEVATAMNTQGQVTPAEPPVTTGPHRSRPVGDSNCLICLDAKADTLLYRCGHLCSCYGCGLRLKQNGAHCPVCRAPIIDIVRAYVITSE